MSQQRISKTKRQTINHLALYHYQSCPFCGITREAIKYMEEGKPGKLIEQRDIQKQPEYRKELIQGGGKAQVPCLRVETDDGAIQWLYESRDIIAFLQHYTNALTAKN